MNNKQKNEYFLSTRLGAVLFLAAVPIAAAGGMVLFPIYAGVMRRLPFSCFLADVVGINCPLCGGTRCFFSLVSGDIAKAFYYNPLAIIGAVLFAALYIWVLVNCLRREYRPCLKVSDRRIIIICCVLLAFFVIRNLPFYRAVFF